jgi:hypothetical protein
MTDYTGFRFGGRNAVLVRPADKAPAVTGSTWARDRTSASEDDGTEIDATFLNRLRANLEALVTGLDGDLNDGDEQIINAILGKFDALETEIASLLEAKAPLSSPALTGSPTAPTVAGTSDSSTKIATTAFVQAVAALKASLESPTFTGTPAAPTVAGTSDSSTKIATTAFVQAVVAALISSAPGVLDTLDELAAALGDDSNFAASMATALAFKAPLASPELTGTPTAPTVAGTSDSSTKIATTAFVQAVLASIAAFVVASQAEAEAGTENTKGMTALRTAQAIAKQSVRAHARITSAGAITSSSNVQSVTKTGTGTYTVTLSVAITNPVAVVSAQTGYAAYVTSTTGGANPVIGISIGVPTVSFNDSGFTIIVAGT